MRQKGQYLVDLIKDLPIPEESVEFRLIIKEPDFVAYGNIILKEAAEFIRTVKGWIIVPVNYEGIRVQCRNHNELGWFLLRMSLHDPVIPLNIESDVKGGIEIIAQKFRHFLKKFNHLDISVFK
jgi:phosphomannomutase